MNSLAVRLIAFFVALIMIAALFIGGSQPGAGSLFPVPWDKVVHLSYFFLLTIVMHQFVRLPLAFTIAMVLLIGAADEFHQFYVPGRTSSVNDWVADALGAGVAFFLLKFVPRKFSIK